MFKVGAGAPEIKSQELLKLQMSSAQAEAKQLALMEVGIKPAMDCSCRSVGIILPSRDSIDSTMLRPSFLLVSLLIICCRKSPEI